MKNKKLVAIGATVVLAASMSMCAFAADYGVHYDGETTIVSEKVETTQQPTQTAKLTFSDVKKSDWYYNPVMNMANKGLIGGMTKADTSGVATYEPNTPMTRAQFVTVITRYLYADEIKAYSGDTSVWYTANYNVAIQEGLIKTSEFANKPEVMNASMTRQEMTLVLVRAMDALGEETGTLISSSQIPDYNNIGSYYKNFVVQAMSKGLIAGIDNVGTFNPKGEMTRGQAATVLNRLIDPSARIKVDTGSVHYDSNNSATGNQTGSQVTANGTVYKEGSNHGIPKAGDTIIKADGTKVVIQYGVGGVLGAGTSCDIWSGVQVTGHTIGENSTSPDGTPFVKCETTGEMHSQTEWAKISAQSPNGKYKGEYEGEYYNIYWKWTNAVDFTNGKAGYWMWQGPMY